MDYLMNILSQFLQLPSDTLVFILLKIILPVVLVIIVLFKAIQHTINTNNIEKKLTNNLVRNKTFMQLLQDYENNPDSHTAMNNLINFINTHSNKTEKSKLSLNEQDQSGAENSELLSKKLDRELFLYKKYKKVLKNSDSDKSKLGRDNDF